MSNKKEISQQYEEELREYAEKLDISTNFGLHETLSIEEHKMLVEGSKGDKFHMTKEFLEFERADLTDFMSWERSDGGTVR